MPEQMRKRSHAPTGDGSKERGRAAGPSTPAPSNAATLDKMRANPEASFADATAGPGEQLPYLTEMETLFGADLGEIAAHTGEEGLTSLGANAATDGESIAFKERTPSKETVRHEVTHVRQAAEAGGGGGSGTSSPSDSAEREAYAVGAGADPGKVEAAPSAGVMLEEDPAAHTEWHRIQAISDFIRDFEANRDAHWDEISQACSGEAGRFIAYGKAVQAEADQMYADVMALKRMLEDEDASFSISTLEEAQWKIENRMTRWVTTYAPMGEAYAHLEEYENEAHTRMLAARVDIYEALPDMKEAVIRQQIYTRFVQLHQDAKSSSAEVERTGFFTEGSKYQEKNASGELDLVAEAVRKSTTPIWFTLTSVLEGLQKEMGDDKAEKEKTGQDPLWTKEEMESAQTQVKFAGTMDHYNNWYTRIKKARQAILEREDLPPKERARMLADLKTFEKQVNSELTAHLANLPAKDQVAEIKGTLKSASDFIGLAIDKPEFKDLANVKEYLIKTGTDKLWEDVIKKPEWRKSLGNAKTGIEKATKALEMIGHLQKMVKSGETVSLRPGARHPAIDGLAAGLEAVNTFNQVPGFNKIVGSYIKMVNGLSKNLAALQIHTKEKLLDWASVNGRLERGLNR